MSNYFPLSIKIFILTILSSNISAFTFKLSGESNMRCFRFRNPKNTKAIRVIEFFYESDLKKKDLQVQLHDELFKTMEDGQSKSFIIIQSFLSFLSILTFRNSNFYWWCQRSKKIIRKKLRSFPFLQIGIVKW